MVQATVWPWWLLMLLRWDRAARLTGLCVFICCCGVCHSSRGRCVTACAGAGAAACVRERDSDKCQIFEICARFAQQVVVWCNNFHLQHTAWSNCANGQYPRGLNVTAGRCWLPATCQAPLVQKVRSMQGSTAPRYITILSHGLPWEADGWRHSLSSRPTSTSALPVAGLYCMIVC